ncbi:MAG: hypothetical protein IT267_12050 [Saprospiraceae bacterium]|nr:hypothetical protein [Saprospiraceae bacterium]
MKYYSIIALLLILSNTSLSAQMYFNGQQLYGNEWIKTNQSYYKFYITEDGFYRIDYQDLVNAGIPLQNILTRSIRLFKNGSEIALRTSSNSTMNPGDFIEFYATHNRGELDQALFKPNTALFNKEFSMFDDKSAYYLTWDNTSDGLRMTEKNNDTSNPIRKEDSYIKKSIYFYSEYATKRAYGYQGSLKLPDFDEGQGFGTGPSNDRTFSLSFKNIYKQGNDAEIKVTYFSIGAEDRTVHKVNFFIDNEVKANSQFNGFKVNEQVLNISAESLNENHSLRVQSFASGDDKFSLSTIELRYESMYEFNNETYAQLTVLPSLTRKTIVIEKFNGGADLWLYDLTNNYYLKSQKNSDDTYMVDLPPSDFEREIIILNPSVSYKNISKIEEVKMVEFEKGDYNYLMVTSKRLVDPNNDAISEYKSYRESKEGGAYKVKLVYIEDLEEQFAYGIRAHNITLRNFFQFTRTIWPNMHYVVIIGKGLEYQVYRNSSMRFNEYDFVHTYSEPASDYMLVCDNNRVPFYTLGRIPIVHNAELRDYLNKVKEHENVISGTQHEIANREWLKKVIHLSGGDPKLYSTLRSQLKGMEDEIENNKFGAEVETFYKESTSSTEVITSEKLQNLINTGVSIISFLGHSISYKLDFSLESVNDYKNKGKYHAFVALGCYAGQMFLNNKSISETQNLTAEKGSVLYISNTNAGLPGLLYEFGTNFYSQLGGDYYNEPVGDAVRAVFSNLISRNQESLISQALSISFNGDPALRLNNNKEIDITPDGNTAKHLDKYVFADQKQFKFSVDLVNLGKAYSDSVKIKLENVYPNGTRLEVFNGNVVLPVNRTNFQFTVPLDENRSTGSNTLLLTVDPDNKLIEGPQPIAENNNSLITGNNQTGFSYIVIGNNARILYPTEFAIINESKPKLVAYNGFLFGRSKYFMELDTTEHFNSPLKRSTEFNQLGGVISWSLTEELIPDLVYYWRVRPDSTGSNILAWKNSSFVYIPGNEIGWNQSHFFQYTKDKFNQLAIKEDQRYFEFGNSILECRLFNGYITPRSTNYFRPKIVLGSDVKAQYDYWDYPSDVSGVVVAFVDPVSGNLVKNITGSDKNSRGGSRMANQPYFLFSTENKEERAKLLGFLKSEIPDQSVVFFQTLVQEPYSLNLAEWKSDGTENLIDFLKSKGAGSIDQLVAQGNLPYNLIYGQNRQGYETRDRIGDTLIELNLAHSLTVKLDRGSLESAHIGPASSYNKMLWNYDLFDPNTDTISVDILGIDVTGKEELILGSQKASSIDLQFVDAKKYPYLKLRWNSKDQFKKSSANLDYWRIYYTSGPDIAFNPALYYKKNADTVQQGKMFSVDITAQNISTYDMDSLLVKFTLIDVKNKRVEFENRYIPVKAFQELTFNYQKRTLLQLGAYKLIVELNPNQDQSEFNTFNNTAIIDYYVLRDIKKPYVRVSFDGVSIRNGDIVSPSSRIVVLLQDEDNSIPMDNPDRFKIKLEYPDGNLISLDPSIQSNVRFIPADTGTSKNEASMIIDGGLIQDGDYKLFVRGSDGNGNFTSETDEVIEFKVVKESSISNVFNYPNPFSSKTRFVYTLTGSKLPEFYKIQIMTLSGKVVRELDESELGILKIGTHLTEMEYDGTDEFGDKLANGVYLYKALFKDSEGNSIKKFENGTDSFFKNNLGKMVIAR